MEEKEEMEEERRTPLSTLAMPLYSRFPVVPTQTQYSGYGPARAL
jgi:hypothetical protein